MAFLKINGADAPSPSEMKVSVFDVSSSETRSASGALVVDRIAVKRKLELRWAVLAPAQLGGLLGQVADAFFSVEYPDPVTAAARSMECFCGNCAAGVLRIQGGEPVWTDVKMEWVER